MDGTTDVCVSSNARRGDFGDVNCNRARFKTNVGDGGTILRSGEATFLGDGDGDPK